MTKTLYLLLGVLFIGGAVYLFLEQPAPSSVLGLTEVRVGEHTLYAELADTRELRELGLSGRESMPGDRVMLFVFENPGVHGIWMKDMNFPIDIVWLDGEKQVITLERGVGPETFPKIFTPTGRASYILELNSGVIDELGMQVGETLNFTL